MIQFLAAGGLGFYTESYTYVQYVRLNMLPRAKYGSRSAFT
jgi:hypothetical protein